MIKSASHSKIKAIFNDDFHYEIPVYQRAYAWKNEQLEELFNDIFENDKGYFIGSIICISEDDKNFKVIDGQQRLTTISLLKNAIYNILKDKRAEFANSDDMFNDFLDLKKSIYDSKTNKLRLKLGIQENNQDDYQALCVNINKLQDEKVIEIKGFKTRRIYKNYEYFLSKIMEIATDENNFEVINIQNIFNFLDKLNSTILVKINVEDAANAFTLFGSLNDRGIPLTPIDLMKNLFIEKFTNEGKDVDLINKKWQEILNNIKDYKDQMRFLKHYYHAFKSDERVEVAGYQNATVTNLIKIYTKLIESKNSKFIFEDLIEKSRIYSKLINPDEILKNDKYVNIKYKEILKDINRIGFAPAFSFILYLFVKKNSLDLTYILSLLDKWNIRRQLTNTPRTGSLDGIFLKLINKIEEKEDIDEELLNKIVVYELSKDIYFSSDEAVLEKLELDVYEAKNLLLRLLLIKLENSRRDKKEERIDFWETDNKGKYLWTIEHILPQNPKKGEKKDEEHDKLIHKLGNLTITGYNSNLSNKNFIDKLNHENGFKTSRVKINNFVANQTKWEKDQIEQRTKILSQEILDLINSKKI